MRRYMLWSQVVVAAIAAVTTLADYGRFPAAFAPSPMVAAPCIAAAMVIPVAIIALGWRDPLGRRRAIEAAVSIGLAAFTAWALLPLVM
jgi:hypothetical protein